MPVPTPAISSGDVRINSVDPTNGLDLTESLLVLTNRPIVQSDLDQALSLLLDWCGNAVAAVREPASAWIQNWAGASVSRGPCTSLVSEKLIPEQAAFANGSLGTLLEMDDLHRASLMHAGDVVIPAALAAAQSADATPLRLLEAIIFGYEIALRLGAVASNDGYCAWYNSATCGVFGAAMAAAHVEGLSNTAKLDALGQAGMQAAGIWQCRLEQTDSKALATGHAARAGITAAQVAKHGCRGPHRILEGPFGFFKAYYPKAEPDDVLINPNDPWKMNEISFKPWPACRHVHPAIGLAIELQRKINIETITEIRIGTYSAAIDFCDNAAPRTPHEARFSLQHCVASALLNGTLRLADCQECALQDPVIAKLRNQVTVKENRFLSRDFPQKMGATLEVRTNEGGKFKLATEHSVGDPEMPMDKEMLKDKFKANLDWAGANPAESLELASAALQLPFADTMVRFNTAMDAVVSSTRTRIGFD